MVTTTTANNQVNLASHKFREQILVVPRQQLALDWQGLKTDQLDHYLQLIQVHQEFHARGLMEQDETYKQIIPYLIFQYQDQLFLMQRAAQASEARLQNKFTLGIGGHVRETDLKQLSHTVNLNNLNSSNLAQNFTNTILAWAQREFYEELSYSGNLQATPVGLLNDDTNSVGRVHLGLVLLLRGDTPAITIKSELQAGQLIKIGAVPKYLAHMESWSQLVCQSLWPC